MNVTLNISATSIRLLAVKGRRVNKWGSIPLEPRLVRDGLILQPKKGATLEDNIRHLTDELSKTVNFYNSSHQETPLSPTTPLLLAGELSSDASKLIQTQIEYPIEPLMPPLAFPPDLPIALYATNIGLGLKKVKAATRFHDINLNILPSKYRARAHLVPMRYLLFSLALAIAISPLFPLYQVKTQAEVETMRLQTELSRVSQELRQARLALGEAKQIEDTINEIITTVNTLKQEHQYILGKRGNLVNNLKLVTNVIPAKAYFTSIEIGTDQITVEGEADSPFTVINYAIALEAQGRFSEVRIANIDEIIKAETTGVSFTIIITRSKM